LRYPFTLFDFGNIDQLFALLAVIGLAAICINHNKTRTSKVLTLDVICFFLLASPLVRRMTAVPIELFNYLAYIIPTALFAFFYTASLLLGCRQYSQIKAGSSWQTKLLATSGLQYGGWRINVEQLKNIQLY
jgi:hypothetical protein